MKLTEAVDCCSSRSSSKIIKREVGSSKGTSVAKLLNVKLAVAVAQQ
jgi:hypothetical protein